MAGPKRLTLDKVLDHAAETHAKRPALLVVDGPGMNYAELRSRVRAFSSLLAGLGVEHGDRVAILGENMPNWGVAYFGVTTMGAVAVPILPEFHASAVQHILRHSESKVAVVSRKLLPKIEDGQLEGLDTILLMEDFEPANGEAPAQRDPFRDAFKATVKEIEKLKALAKTAFEGKDADPDAPESDTQEVDAAASDDAPATDGEFAASDAPQTRMEVFRKRFQAGMREIERIKEKTLKRAGDHAAPPEHAIAEDDLAAIIYTSGTTGHSKGVMLTHRNIVSNAIDTAALAGLTASDRMVSILPLSHTFECTLGLVLPITAGASVAYLGRPPTPKVLLPALAKVRPTFLLCVPLVVEKIFKNRIQPQFTKNFATRRLYGLGPVRRKMHAVAGRKLVEAFGGELRCLCIGGAPLAPEVERFLRDGDFPFAVGYGKSHYFTFF